MIGLLFSGCQFCDLRLLREDQIGMLHFRIHINDVNANLWVPSFLCELYEPAKQSLSCHLILGGKKYTVYRDWHVFFWDCVYLVI